VTGLCYFGVSIIDFPAFGTSVHIAHKQLFTAAAADVSQVTGLCYFGVPIVGFHAFGTAVPDNVLLAFAHGSHFWVVSAANLMVVVHVTAAYQGGALDSRKLQEQQQRPRQQQRWRGHGISTTSSSSSSRISMWLCCSR
jgi:hypothetical protein